ncbi:MAG TPA: type II toxin-antitoxin system VapC family toxin [Chthoniobacterales bacterium]
MLFDTDIFIWAQRGNAAAARMIDGADARFISIQTYMEFLQGARDARQMVLNKSFLRDLDFTTLGFTENIGHRAAIYIESYALAHGLRSGDALVAATALENDLPLATANGKHYRAIPGLKIKLLKP